MNSFKKIFFLVGKLVLPKNARNAIIKFIKAVWNTKKGRHIDLRKSFDYDRQRFETNSSAVSGPENRAKLQAVITIDYHRIEKALSLPDIRPTFGEAVVQRLIDNTRHYIESYGYDRTSNTVLNTLHSYEQFRNSVNAMPDSLSVPLSQLQALAREKESSLGKEGGTIDFLRSQLDPDARVFFKHLAFSRHSIRNFTGEAVDPEIVYQAVEIAGRSPSVCNRQSCGVYCYFDSEQRNLALSFQNGNAGFGHLAGAVLIVVSDQRCFTSVGERYQCWIDGGMFSMSLIYALHAAGLGTCCLNWSATVSDDRELRDGVGIRKEDSVVMMIAVGHIPGYTIQVASSPRRPISELLRNST